MVRRWLLIPLSVVLVAGCAHPQAEAPLKNDPWHGVPIFPTGPRQVMTPQGPRDPRDPQPVVPVIVNLSLYKISVPRGTVSTNEDFWKHVDEHQLDPFHYDVLLKNGIRAGVAPQADWDYFKEILGRNPVTYQESGSAGIQTTTMDIPLKDGLLSQQLIFSDGSGDLAGQAYDRCEDLISLVFAPVYRQTGVVHVKLTPLVRALREKIELTSLGNELHYAFVHPEYLYDVNLDTTIPVNFFLVVSPSSEAVNKTSIGCNFLTHENKGQQFETLLLISPHALRLESPPPGTAPAAQK